MLRAGQRNVKDVHRQEFPIGLLAGASLAVTFAVAVLGYTGAGQFICFALAGAFGLTVLVYTLGSIGADRGSPVKLTLAGVAFTAVCGGFTSAMALKNTTRFDVVRFWGVGSIGGRSLDILPIALPLTGAGLVLGLCSAGSLNALALGDDLARSLGTRLAPTRVVLVVVTLLAGTSVAGPISFVGLMVPHGRPGPTAATATAPAAWRNWSAPRSRPART